MSYYAILSKLLHYGNKKGVEIKWGINSVVISYIFAETYLADISSSNCLCYQPSVTCIFRYRFTLHTECVLFSIETKNVMRSYHHVITITLGKSFYEIPVAPTFYTF